MWKTAPGTRDVVAKIALDRDPHRALDHGAPLAADPRGRLDDLPVVRARSNMCET
jgi:hypothetical protein